MHRAMHTIVTQVSRSGWLAFGVLSSTGCPFCTTMISEVLGGIEEAEAVEQLDLAELLDRSVDYSRATVDEAAE